MAMDEADGLDAKELSFLAVIKNTPISNFPWPKESFKIISWSKTNWLSGDLVTYGEMSCESYLRTMLHGNLTLRLMELILIENS